MVEMAIIGRSRSHKAQNNRAQYDVVLAVAFALFVCLPSVGVLLAQGERNSGSGRVSHGQRADNTKISGIAVATDSRQAVARATVTLRAESGEDSEVAQTNDQGQFMFSGVRPGRYRIQAFKSGYVSVSSQSTPLMRSGIMVDVVDGAERTIELWFAKGARIAGRLTDDDGEPLVEASVHLLRREWLDGSRKLIPVAQLRTDDRGEYRAWDLIPGTYYVRAQVDGLQNGHAPAWLQAHRRPPTGAAEMATLGYVPTYYPGTPHAAEAQSINIGLSQDLLGVDFAVVRAGVANVAGYALDPDGAPAAAGVVALMPESSIERAQVGVSYSSLLSADGRFSIPNVPFGNYILTARVTTNSRYGSARETVAIYPSGSSNLQVTTSPAATITGRLTYGRSRPPRDGGRIQIALVPLEPPAGMQAKIVVKPDGAFVIENVPPGPALIRVSGNPDGWFLESVVVAGQDVTDTPLDIKNGQQIVGATILFSDNPTEVSGTVSDPASGIRRGCLVIAFPTEEERWWPGSRRVAATRSDNAGRFSFRGLPKGEYYLAAIDQCDHSVELDPDTFREYVNKASRFRLETGSHLTKNLRIGS